MQSIESTFSMEAIINLKDHQWCLPAEGLSFSPSMMLFRPTIIKDESGEPKKLPAKIVQALFGVVIINTFCTK